MINIAESVKINFSNMGLFKGENDWIHPERVLPTYEMIFVVEGKVHLKEGEQKHELSKGDFMCLKPNVVYKGYQESSNVKFYYLHFYADDYEKIGVYRYKFSDSTYQSAFFEKLYHEFITGAQKELIECRLAVFLLEIKNSLMQKSKIFYDVCQYVRENVRNNPTVKNIGEKFSYHPDYLSKVFIKNTGMPLKNYIDGERNAYVKNLLLTTDYSLKEIAQSCAFENDNALIKFFKYNNEGLTPTGFRNLYYAPDINDK